jgi:hypothetical protein
MKALYAYASRGLKDYGQEYQHMRKYLIKKGCDFLIDELDENLKKYVVDDYPKKPYHTSLTQRARVVSQADVVVLDVSHPTLGLGLVISLAVQMGKPTLMLYSSLSPDKTLYESYLRDASPVFRAFEYSNQKDKEKAIDEFIELYSPDVRARFNLVYRKDLDNYLEWGAFTYNTTKTQLIIDAISEKRERDELYQKLEKKK